MLKHLFTPDYGGLQLLLKQVTLHKYGQFEHVELEIPAERHAAFGSLRVTLIVGQNGTGKTTLFRFLTDLFSEVPNPNLEGCSATYRMSRSRTISGESRKPPVELPHSIIISTYSPADGFSRVVNRQDRVVPMKYLGLDMDRMYRELKNPSRVFLSEVVSTMLGESDARRKQVALLLDRIGFSGRINLEIDGDPEPLKWRIRRVPVEAHRTRLLFDREAYLAAGERWMTFVQAVRVDKRPVARRRLQLEDSDLEQYSTGVEGLAADLATLANAPRNIAYLPITGLVFQREERWIPLEGFSSGERALFFRFLGLIREMTDNAIVLIDEPEIHLHPQWVQRFVGLLATLFSDVNAHVLIASHSPLIASDVPADCILGLRKVDTQIVPYTIKDRSLGTSPSIILREVFGVHDDKGDFTQQVIDRIRTFIKEKKHAQAMALYDLLGDSDEKYQLFQELRRLSGRG